MYNRPLEVAILGAVFLILGLIGWYLVRREQKAKGEPPRYLGYVKPDRYRVIHGYDPTMRDWAPKHGTIVPRGGYGNE